MITAILGGIGLFLLGMVLLTEGSKTAAGDTLRRLLSRFTGGPLRAFVSGAAATVVVQSSSATILTTIGFVSAGLLTFPQSVGVIFGAAAGTTSTGWLVSLLGLRLQISVVALPLVGIGALMRLLTAGRTASIGLAVAGFGLIFVGIDTLQTGMQALSAHLDPAAFPGQTWGGRVLLVGIGVLMTVVMQSSSAAVATTLTALHAETIGLEQAALLVVGQNAGTAVTAALASIGASVAARRTALAHVLFNGFAAVLGLAVLPLLLRLAGTATAHRLGVDGALAVAAFHTGFNLLAVAVLLPLTGSFAGLVVRLLPERGPTLSRYLDPSVAGLGPVAVEAARRTTVEAGAMVLDAARRLLAGEAGWHGLRAQFDTAHAGLVEIRRFLGTVNTSPAAAAEHERHLAVLHALDHFDRLIDALRDPGPVDCIRADADLRGFAARLADQLGPVLLWLEGGGGGAPVESVRQVSHSMAATRRGHRPLLMAQTAAGQTDPERALAQLDAMRWLDRVAYHVWRATEHLGSESSPTSRQSGLTPSEAGVDERA